MHRHSVILENYRIERPTLRVGEELSAAWIVWSAAIACIMLAKPTMGLSFFFLPIVIGFLRNRPLTGIVVWDLAFGWTGIGWIVALVKAVGNR